MGVKGGDRGSRVMHRGRGAEGWGLGRGLWGRGMGCWHGAGGPGWGLGVRAGGLGRGSGLGVRAGAVGQGWLCPQAARGPARRDGAPMFSYVALYKFVPQEHQDLALQ